MNRKIKTLLNRHLTKEDIQMANKHVNTCSTSYVIGKLQIKTQTSYYQTSICCCSVNQSCPTFCNPMNCSTPGFPDHHQLPELIQTHVHQVGDASNHLILCRPLLLLPSIFPSFRVFYNKSVLCIRWPKYWSFSSSISPSKEYSGLISIRMD